MKGVSTNDHPCQGTRIHGTFPGSLHIISSLDDNANLSLKVLSLKLVMLLALTRPSRSSNLSSLDLKFLPDGIQFHPSKLLAKQSRPSKSVVPFLFPSFPSDKKLCPKVILQSYGGQSPIGVLVPTGNPSYSCHT